MLRPRKLLVAAVIAVSLGASPAHAQQGSGSVGATINITPPPVACITLSRSTISFPSTALTPAGAAPNVASDSQQGLGITNCSTASAVLFASATNATVGAASWTLGTVNCTLVPPPVNTFGAIASSDGTILRLTNGDSGFLQGVGAGTQRFVLHQVEMPCAGSTTSGASTAAFTVRYTATV